MKKLFILFSISVLFLSACSTTSVNLGDDREYYSESKEACEKIEFVCDEGTEVFSDTTGCGCEDIEEEDSNIIIVDDEEPADEEPADEEPADEEPADEVPADEEPADEEPADEEPADEEPADEEPADEEGDDDLVLIEPIVDLDLPVVDIIVNPDDIVDELPEVIPEIVPDPLPEY